MQVIHSPQEMQSLALKWRSEGKKIAFVPTVGALHEGHLSLLREGRKLANKLVLSIFVNPTQFASTEDLAKYPRPIERDLELARDCKTDAVFFPTNEMMYPKGYQTYVEVTLVTKGLCGESRPTHFRGVTTVVQKLFNIVQPDIAIFGEKDYQQFITIKTMVRDLDMPVKIVGMPTLREADDLAMSSRNVYLKPDERKAALSLSRSLKLAQKLVKEGERDVRKLTVAVEQEIVSTKIPKIDYVKICDSETLEELKEIDPNLPSSPSSPNPPRLLIAAFVGTTRLIDNCQL